MSYTITTNHQFNSLEISFAEKPTEAIRDALKALKFRWNAAKKIWYGFSTEEEIKTALSGEVGEAAKTEAKPETINLDNLGQNTPSLYGAELAAAIREDLKKRGARGCTVRTRKVTHETGIIVTVTASEKDFTSIEEFEKRYPFAYFAADVESHGRFTGVKWCYSLEGMTEEEKQKEYYGFIRYEIESRHDYNEFHRERKNYPQFTTAFCEKLEAVWQIANQWNYDNSDTMSDYFDIGYYLDIEIKAPKELTARETMTEEEKKIYTEEKRQEEAERAAAIAKYEQERKEAEERRKAYEEQRNKDREIIYNNITVEDLAEDEQLYITRLAGGIGKECSLKELDEEIRKDGNETEALITRKVIFKTREAFETFGEYLLDDFDFLENKGGTATDDVRMEGVDLYKLTEEQRRSVKTYLCDCVGFYLNNKLVLVSDPEGYSYSRYTYRPTERTQVLNATEETEKQRKESEEKTPFYFPAPIAEQIKNIKVGERVTVLQTDGWLLTNIFDSCGVVESVSEGKSAQHEGYYINYVDGKKTFIRDGKKALVYSGYLAWMPDEVTKRRVNDRMSELLTDGELFKAALKYYEEVWRKTPLIDTIQR